MGWLTRRRASAATCAAVLDTFMAGRTFRCGLQPGHSGDHVHDGPTDYMAWHVEPDGSTYGTEYFTR